MRNINQLLAEADALKTKIVALSHTANAEILDTVLAIKTRLGDLINSDNDFTKKLNDETKRYAAVVTVEAKTHQDNMMAIYGERGVSLETSSQGIEAMLERLGSLVDKLTPGEPHAITEDGTVALEPPTKPRLVSSGE